MSEKDWEDEEAILKESIVNAVGLSSDTVQIGIRGDPSMRETTFERKRYHSDVDDLFSKLEPNLEDLLLNRSTYKLFIGFNNGEIRTTSVFDPLREEIHSADKLAETSYVKRQFPAIAYDDKVQLMKNMYTAIREDPLYKVVPVTWSNILARRSSSWKPMDPAQIHPVVSSLLALRMMDDYYLRNVTISIVQGIVRMQFNCDGTQLVSIDNFRDFLEQNLVSQETEDRDQ